MPTRIEPLGDNAKGALDLSFELTTTATPAFVFAALRDYWSEWTPILRGAVQSAIPGERLELVNVFGGEGPEGAVAVFSLEPFREGTRLRLRHRAPGMFPFESIELWDVSWRLAIASLDAYLDAE